MFDPSKYLDQGTNETKPSIIVPPGEYPVKIVFLNLKRSNNGNPGINLKFSILDGDYKGESFWLIFWLTEKSAWRLAKFMKGWRFAQPFDENNLDEIKRIFIGKMGWIRVQKREFNGYETNEFQSSWTFTEGEFLKYSQGINVTNNVQEEESPFGNVQPIQKQSGGVQEVTSTLETAEVVQPSELDIFAIEGGAESSNDDPFGW